MAWGFSRSHLYLTYDKTTHPRVFNHVAVSVPDVQKAIDWYASLFGFQLLGNILHLKRSANPEAAIFGIYPPNLNEVKIAYLATGNGVGFEIFEFVDPEPQPSPVFEYQRRGFFHICITDPSPDELAEKVEASGGKRIGRTMDPAGQGTSKCLYLSDPWGNVIEVLNVSFEWLACKTAY